MAIIYVRGANPIWFFNNLTGQVLDDTYWAFFLTNDFPYVPQNVFQDPNGISAWSNPIEFQPSGGLPNNLYFDPSLTYRIEIRQGPNQTDPLISPPIQDFIPGTGSGSGSLTSNPLVVAENIITNPQFADIDFVSPFTFIQGSVGTYTVDVAPGWQLILTGAGTTILTQGTIPGSNNDFGNPAYYLDINNNNWSSALLVQTLTNNGAIFANGAVAVAFTAQTIGSNEVVSVQYIPNGTSNSQNIFSGQISTGGFKQYYGLLGGPTNPFNPSVNANTDGSASVQIGFNLPGSGIVDLTNIQVTGQSTSPTTDFVEPTITTQGSVPNYQELTYEQMVNAEFHVYKNSILNKSKNSILTAWNFSNNPWQFRTTSSTNVATNTYTADQTIIVQQAYVTSATGNNIAVGQGSAAENYSFKVTAVTAANKFALIQYIDPASIRNYWGQIMSSMVMAKVASPTHNTQCKFKIRLIWRTSLPSTIGQNEPILSWTNVDGSDPVFSAGWTAIAPLNDPEYTFNLTEIGTFDFNQFQLPASSNVDMTLGIVLYTTKNLDQTATADAVSFHDISLVPNNFSLPTQAETFDETMQKCQYYYEKTYINSVLPAAADTRNQLTFNQGLLVDGSSNYRGYAESFGAQFNTLKRSIPTLTVYCPSTGTTGEIDAFIYLQGASLTASPITFGTYWASSSLGTKDFTFDANADQLFLTHAITGGNQNVYTTIKLHYTADSRLGI